MSLRALTFSNPSLCPIIKEDICLCPEFQSCTLIIITNLQMPLVDGLKFIKDQIVKGCKCEHIALVSGYFTDGHLSKAKSLGLKIFIKPFRLDEMKKWLDSIEKKIDPDGKLADWYLNKISHQDRLNK